MKSLFLALVLWATLLAPLTVAFTSDDHEIFRLKDELDRTEGPDGTFYSFLGVSSSASQDDISKAYRKKSRLIHPDKAKAAFIAAHNTQKHKPPLLTTEKKKPRIHVNKPPSQSEIQKAVVRASERYARLGIVAEVLKGPGRARYDHFLSNGFPAWRGTGYYYARFRPGLGTVLLGLFVFGGGAVHYGAMYLGWKRQRAFVEKYIKQARKAAWGDEGGIRGVLGVEGAVLGSSVTVPGEALMPAQENGAAVLNRRQRRMQAIDEKREKRKGKGTSGKGESSGTSTPMEEVVVAEASTGPVGARKKVQAENGKVLIVDSMGDVYLDGENEDGVKGEYLLNPESIPKPRLDDTVLYRLPVYLYEVGTQRVWGERLTGQRLGEGADAIETTGEGNGTDEEHDKRESIEKNPKKKSQQLAEARKRGGKKKSQAS